MTESQNRIFILAPVYNRREVTRQFLLSVKAQNFTNWHLLLIDDGSSDGTSEMARHEVGSLTVIRGTGNWWWAGCLSRAYRWLKVNVSNPNDIVLIINDDTSFHSDFLSNALKELENERRTLLLAKAHSKTTGDLVDEGVFIDWRTYEYRSPTTLEPANCFSTRGLFMRIKDIDEIGGFHPILLPHYGSDYEFTMRAIRKGFRLKTSSRVCLTMDEHATGIRKAPTRNYKEFFGAIFSKRSTLNPVYQSMFVLLSCPMRYKLLNVARVWWGFYLSLRSVTQKEK